MLEIYYGCQRCKTHFHESVDINALANLMGRDYCLCGIEFKDLLPLVFSITREDIITEEEEE